MVDVSLQRRGAKWQSTLSYRHQNGHFPTCRLGHSLNRVGDDGHVLLYGGRERVDQTTALASHMFADTTPASAYLYDIQTGTWISTPIFGDVPGGRAYHTTTSLGNNEFLVFGGLEFVTHQKTTSNLSAYKLTYNPSSKVLHSATLPHSDSRLQLVRHRCMVLDDHNLFVLGGFIPGQQRKTPNRDCFVVNREGIVKTVFSSSFDSLCNVLAKDGEIFVYTTKGIQKVLKETVLEQTSSQEIQESPSSSSSSSQPQPRSPSPQPSTSQESSLQVSPSPEAPSSPAAGLPSALEPVLRGTVVGGSCGAGEDCVGDGGDMLQCDKCDLFFHFQCQGFSVSPFADHEEQMNSQFFCTKCRQTFRSRKHSLLEKSKGIIFPPKRD